jgi:hypothetical protein
LAWLPQASIEHQRRVPGREVSMNKIVQSGPAQDRTCAMSPEREMVIRVTHIYRRFGEEWMLVHRHADFPPADQRRA